MDACSLSHYLSSVDDPKGARPMVGENPTGTRKKVSTFFRIGDDVILIRISSFLPLSRGCHLIYDDVSAFSFIPGKS